MTTIHLLPLFPTFLKSKPIRNKYSINLLKSLAMTVMILENNYEGYDNKELIVLHNINVLPCKGDEIVIKDKHYIVESFLWHTHDSLEVTMFVDWSVRVNGYKRK
jgi:hypothetical protein